MSSSNPAQRHPSGATVVRTMELRHNTSNAVTQSLDEVVLDDGRVLIRKRLGVVKAGVPDHWRASQDPGHWNWWRREAAAYRSRGLTESLRGTGLAMADADVTEDGDGATLWLERVAGTPGPSFALPDHLALSMALGRWQARSRRHEGWWSTNYLSDYSTGKPVPSGWEHSPGWQSPLVRDCWPPELAVGWSRLMAARGRLLDIMARLPRVLSHLDVWPVNAIRRPGGEVVLVDWAFGGDGARGEDLGNHIPDSVFDLFWPHERLEELEGSCVASYLEGLREGGWRGDEREVRLGVVASCVKYAWLLPQMVVRAGDETTYQAYFSPADGEQLYAARGAVFATLVRWADEALELAPRLGL